MGYKTIRMHLMLGSYGFEISTVQRTKKMKNFKFFKVGHQLMSNYDDVIINF